MPRRGSLVARATGPGWRHAWATGLLRHREDLHVAQRLLGHSTMATIIGYVHRSDADLMDAVDRAFPAA